MPDREKVMHGLECCSTPGGNCEICPYNIVEGFAECTSALAKDSLELLKEQKQKIDILEDQNARLIRQKEARFQPVRCKDCKHYRYYGLSEETVSECTIDHCEKPYGNWFCADGEPETH